MNRKVLLLGFIVSSLAATARPTHSLNKNEAKSNITISGHIEHPLADTVCIRYTPMCVKYSPQDFKARLEHGDFKISFKVADGYTSLTLVNGSEGTELFVRPGAKLSLTLDGRNFDSTLHYEGTGKEIANYSAKCVLEKHTIRDIDTRAQNLSDKEPQEYEAALKNLVANEKQYLLQNGNELPSDFREFLLRSHQYEVYYTMYMYPRTHEMMKHKSMNVKEIPRENYVVIDDIPVAFNDDYLGMQSYRGYLSNFFALQVSAENARKGVSMGTEEWTDSVLERSCREMPPLSAEFITATRIFNSIQYTPIAQVGREFEWYKQHFARSKNLSLLSAEIEKRRLIGPGKPAMDFDIVTPEDSRMKLSDLRGKVVYLDFWSRYCAPCIGEMAEARKIREHFKNQPVAFVYVSEDENDSVWKAAINEFGIEAINTRLDKGRLSAIVDKYEANALPSHYLIDKDGKFAKVDKVERPGNKDALIAQIEDLLRQK